MGQREGDLLTLSRSQLTEEGIAFTIGKSKRRHPRHGKIVETAKKLIIEWTPELHAITDRLKKLGPDIRPTLLCNLQGKPFTSDGFRSNWHRLMERATTAGQDGAPTDAAAGSAGRPGRARDRLRFRTLGGHPRMHLS